MPRVIGRPLLKPRIILRYPRELGKLTRIMVYHSFSRWQEILYPQVIAQTPVSQSQDERHPRGFVRRHIKLITTTGEKGLKYRAISVPGGTVRGSPAFHALSAIYAYHGVSGRPLRITAKAGSVLTFPLKRGQTFTNPKTARQGPGRTRGPRNWVVTKKVYQPKWGKANPWISRIFESNKGMLTKILHQEMLATRRVKREKRIAVG